MSDIKVNDLVMVVRHCCTDENNGKIGTVLRVFVSSGACWHCHTNHKGIASAQLLGLKHRYRLSWLKRIEPPAESERIEQREEITV